MNLSTSITAVYTPTCHECDTTAAYWIGNEIKRLRNVRRHRHRTAGGDPAQSNQKRLDHAEV